MNGYEALTEAVRVVAPPGAPPRTSIEGATVGLSFLDTVLRLNHVRRLTDRLTIVEHRSARRTTEVDIDLGMLDENQRQAAALFQKLVSQKAQSTDGQSTVWVPVARISRQSVAPVDVLDASGQKLPRLTQFETSRLLASALYHLLRGILASQPHARKEDTPLNHFLFIEHEARWLVQAALQTLLTDRNRPQDAVSHHNTERQARHRSLALQVLASYEDELSDYRSLLDIAVNDYLLVVALDGRTNEHLLTYDSPLPAHSRQTLSLATKLRVNSRGYLAEYRSVIPASLRSYHLVVETEHGVNIDRMYLSTDADRVLVDELCADLDTLAGRMEPTHRSRNEQAATRPLELAMDTTLQHVAELLRRKQWDSEQAGLSFVDEHLSAPSELGRAAINGQIVSKPNGHGDSSILSHQTVDPSTLRLAAEQLRTHEVDHDLALENDPVINRAHAYWRRHAGRLTDSTPQIAVRAGMILRDVTATGPISVFWYAAVISAISYLLAFLLTGSPFPYGPWAFGELSNIAHREAVIAVLLLVPGFLYTRLAMPDKHSISGYLRALPRLVAHMCIGSMAFVAAAIAAGSPGAVVAYLFAMSVAAPLASATFTVYPTVAGWWRRRNDKAKRTAEQEIWLIGAPHWVFSNRQPNEKRWKSDVVLQSTGGRS